MRAAQWVVVAIVALLGTRADARRPAPATGKTIVKKGVRIAKKPKLAAIAKTAKASPPAIGSAPANEPPKAPTKIATTNDPILAGADRVVGRDHAGLVAFTFDDGPNPPTTPVVIDALQHYDIPATFFIVTRHITTASRAQDAKKLLAKELELGYTVGNHTWHHANLQKANDKKLGVELDAAFTKLSEETKRPIGLFRAPYGRMNARARAHLQQLGATEVYWSIDSRDWETAEENAGSLRKRILHAIITENGGVVLLHDSRKVTASVIHGVLDDLEGENCRRLAVNKDPIWPVSLHYFLRDGGQPRAIPDDVQKRTAEYKQALPDRCAKRATDAAAAAVPAKPANK